MRRFVVVLLVPVLLLSAGCASVAGGRRAPAGGTASPAGGDPDLYVAVLRRYLGTPAESSFGGLHSVYVLDRTDARAADPMRAMGPGAGAPFAAADQQQIVAALQGPASVRFVGSPDDVVVHRGSGCAQVRDGGILILLAPPVGRPGRPERVEVGISGFVACEGATWLTYVVQRQAGGWWVSSTTGAMAIA